MGWTSMHATHYKNGTVDRKKECDYYWEGGLNSGHFEIVKSRIVGSIYYAAIKPLKKYIGKNEEGEYQYTDIPLAEQEIIAVVMLTSTNMKDYYNFSYKGLDETMLPYYYDCPISILKVLSETNNESAKEWRRRCYEKIQQKKNPNALNNLPEDTIVEIVLPWNTQYYKEGDVLQVKKRKWNRRTRWFVCGTNKCFSKRMMECFEDNYKLIERGDTI